ncbi:putative quinone-forming monooxygenase [Streptomyces sp. Tu6071]|nr:putative quinone-forming monooxygenase [Streptomyces sp. Tu6071]
MVGRAVQAQGEEAGLRAHVGADLFEDREETALVAVQEHLVDHGHHVSTRHRPA